MSKRMIQCECGSLVGEIHPKATFTRVVCYCRDCQAFAHFLGKENEALDPRGGTEVAQTVPRLIEWKEGLDNLACMRLSPKGLMRWYASCCNTPIGNTMENTKISFVGLTRPCWKLEGTTPDEAFGPLRAVVNTQHAKGNPPPKSYGVLGVILRFVFRLFKERITGNYKKSNFCDASGKPIVTPKVISKDERLALNERVGS